MLSGEMGLGPGAAQRGKHPPDHNEENMSEGLCVVRQALAGSLPFAAKIGARRAARFGGGVVVSADCLVASTNGAPQCVTSATRRNGSPGKGCPQPVP